ncbi:MAG: glycosyltransferase [Actinomycetota bacterium]|nr:glycosyltransferase [Actinomycetota bacterium]
MRILIAHSFYRRPGGEDSYVRRQVQLLQGRHEVALVARENTDSSPTVRTAAAMVYSPRRRQEIEAAIRDFDPDVIHLHNAYPGWGPAVHLAADHTRTPLVMTVHNLRLRCPNGLMFTEGELCRRCTGGVYLHGVVHRCFESRGQATAYATSLWLHRFPGRLERRVARFIAPSRFMAQRLGEWGFEPDKVKLVRSFSGTVAEADAARAPEKTYGLFLGRLSSEKGPDVLLDALSAAGDPPFRIVGGGSLLEVLRTRAQTLGLRNLTIEGWVEPSRARVELDRAQYLVLPSVCEENAPLAALDSLGCGKPVIVSDRGGLPELADGGRGLVTRAGDVHDLAAAVRRLAEDPRACVEMGRAGALFARRHLTPQAHLDALENVYSTAA